MAQSLRVTAVTVLAPIVRCSSTFSMLNVGVVSSYLFTNKCYCMCVSVCLSVCLSACRSPYLFVAELMKINSSLLCRLPP